MKKLLITLTILILSGGQIVMAENIDRHLAIMAIVGEAENQGFKGMIAIGCAIRNRGTLHGVVGVTSKRINAAPRWVWEEAERAWDESAKKDITFGSDHWENVGAFGEPSWAKKMTKTVKIKNHQFYKSKG